MAIASRHLTSDSGKNLAMAVGALLMGGLFLWLTRHSPEGDSNATAAMWLGVLLAAVGLAGIIFHEQVVVTVDPGQGSLRIDYRRRWGSVSRVMSFDEVGSVEVVRVGSRSKGTPSFWLQIRLKNGRTHGTGQWSTDESAMRRLAEELSSEIGCDLRAAPPAMPASMWHVITAALGALALYALWFRVSVGFWCPAMWFGTAPPFFILTAFALLLSLLRRLRV